MKNGLLVKYGEIAIRGKNRYIFERSLINSIKKNIREFGSDYYINKEQGRLFIFNKNGNVDLDRLIPKVLTVFGIVGVCPCIVFEDKNFETVKETVMAYFDENYGDLPPGTTFKVHTKRGDKQYPDTSDEISAKLGEMILNAYPNLKVLMKNPDLTVYVEIRTNCYVYAKIIKGLGGLPPGTSGKGMLLLSGGIDSPVAGFLMGKRGVCLEAVYFHSPPYTSQRAREKVIDLAKKLSIYCGSLRLHIIPFTQCQLYLYDHVPAVKMTIFLKRAMMKISGIIAEESGASCLILGDSVGQVASQTLQSINAVNSSTNLPILRPLASFDKQEIIDIAKEIDTFEISIRPYEDCCTIFVADHPETKPKRSVIEQMEQKMDGLNTLIEVAVTSREIVEI